MPVATLKLALLWCAAINYGVLVLWFVLIVFARDAFHRISVRFFRVTPQVFDAVNYGGIAAYKLFIVFFNLVPYVALVLTT